MNYLHVVLELEKEKFEDNRSVYEMPFKFYYRMYSLSCIQNAHIFGEFDKN